MPSPLTPELHRRRELEIRPLEPAGARRLDRDDGLARPEVELGEALARGAEVGEIVEEGEGGLHLGEVEGAGDGPPSGAEAPAGEVLDLELDALGLELVHRWGREADLGLGRC